MEGKALPPGLIPQDADRVIAERLPQGAAGPFGPGEIPGGVKAVAEGPHLYNQGVETHCRAVLTKLLSRSGKFRLAFPFQKGGKVQVGHPNRPHFLLFRGFLLLLPQPGENFRQRPRRFRPGNGVPVRRRRQQVRQSAAPQHACGQQRRPGRTDRFPDFPHNASFSQPPKRRPEMRELRDSIIKCAKRGGMLHFRPGIISRSPGQG